MYQGTWSPDGGFDINRAWPSGGSPPVLGPLALTPQPWVWLGSGMGMRFMSQKTGISWHCLLVGPCGDLGAQSLLSSSISLGHHTGKSPTPPHLHVCFWCLQARILGLKSELFPREQRAHPAAPEAAEQGTVSWERWTLSLGHLAALGARWAACHLGGPSKWVPSWSVPWPGPGNSSRRGWAGDVACVGSFRQACAPAGPRWGWRAG